MADFQASIVDINSVLQVVLDTDDLMTINDTSNYLTTAESGALVTDFYYFRKIIVTDPNGIEYIFSSLGDGDQLIGAGDSGITQFSYTLSNAVDGVYTITLITVPSWNAASIYSNTSYVVDSITGLFYKSILNTNTNQDPATATNYWTEVTEDEVSSRFNTYGKVARTKDLEICKLEATEEMACHTDNCKNICDSDAYNKAAKMFMLLSAISSKALLGEWNEVEELISTAKQICAC